MIFSKTARLLEMKEQFSTINVIEDKIYLLLCLKGKLEVDKEWVVVINQDVLFRARVFDLCQETAETERRLTHGDEKNEAPPSSTSFFFFKTFMA